MILGVGHSYPGGPAENRIYLNTGGTFSASSPVLLPFPEIATNLENRNSAVFIDAADIDGNGLLDIAIGFENPGNGQGAGPFYPAVESNIRDGPSKMLRSKRLGHTIHKPFEKWSAHPLEAKTRGVAVVAGFGLKISIVMDI